MKRSLQRWLWFGAAILISTVVYATIRYGLRPKPIPVMNATAFQQAEEIGAVIYKRLRQEVRAEQALVLGSDPDLKDYPEIWTGFLKAAVADNVKIEAFFERESLSLPWVMDGWPVVPFAPAKIASGELFNNVKARVGPGHLVVIHGPTDDVSHLTRDSLSRGLDAALQHPVLSISSVRLNLKPEEDEALQLRCVSALPGDPAARLDCAQARVSKILRKKKLEESPLWAVVERDGLKEYLVFVYR
jgi:hypothetical protein